jgi:urease accessory protein
METLALLRLAQLADSAFPSGGFAFSGGLEVLLNEAQVRGESGIEALLAEQVLPRWASFDRWYLVRTHTLASAAGQDGEALGTALSAIDRRCEVQSSCAALAEASRRMGRSALTSAGRLGLATAIDYAAMVRAGTAHGHLPVVQGLLGAALAMPRPAIEAAAVHALLMGTLSAAVRMGAIGALAAQAVLLRLGETAAARLAEPLPDGPHAFSPLADIAAARRGRLAVPLFAA